MKYVIQCPCGVSFVADDRESLIDEVCAHAEEAHGKRLTREQAADMISMVGTERLQASRAGRRKPPRS